MTRHYGSSANTSFLSLKNVKQHFLFRPGIHLESWGQKEPFIQLGFWNLSLPGIQKMKSKAGSEERPTTAVTAEWCYQGSKRTLECLLPPYPPPSPKAGKGCDLFPMAWQSSYSQWEIDGFCFFNKANICPTSDWNAPPRNVPRIRIRKSDLKKWLNSFQPVNQRLSSWPQEPLSESHFLEFSWFWKVSP